MVRVLGPQLEVAAEPAPGGLFVAEARPAPAPDRVPLVERVAEASLPVGSVNWRAIGYRSELDGGGEHLALVLGEVTGATAPVHLHSRCLWGDVFGSRLCSCGTELNEALEAIEKLGCGVVVYIHRGGAELAGGDAEPGVGGGCQPDRLDREIGALILADLGCERQPTSVAASSSPPSRRSRSSARCTSTARRTRSS